MSAALPRAETHCDPLRSFVVIADLTAPPAPTAIATAAAVSSSGASKRIATSYSPKQNPPPRSFPPTFLTIGFAAAPGILGIVTIIPILGWLLLFVLWIWQIAAMVIAVREVLDYTDTMKAVIVVVIGWLIQLLVTILLGMMFLGSAMISGMISN